jgi:hypothetical protein
MSCGAEMRLMQVERDETAQVAGTERQTLQCPSCHDIEIRNVLRRDSESPAEPAVESQALLQPEIAIEPEPSVQPRPLPPPADQPLKEASPQPANGFDDAELLLQRAIDMIRGTSRPAQPARALAESDAQIAPAAPTAAPAAPMASAATMAPAATIAPATPTAPTATTAPAAEVNVEIDEAEEMLRRAIAMVRGPAQGGKPGRVQSIAAKRPPGRIVRICHDPSFEPAYAAKDTTSGLVVIRHQDSARLRAMCDRLGWQVVDIETPATGT